MNCPTFEKVFIFSICERSQAYEQTILSLHNDRRAPKILLLLLEYIQLLFRYDVASNSTCWLHMKLFMEYTHTTTSNIGRQFFKVGHSFHLHTASAYNNVCTQNKRSRHTDYNNVSPIRTAMELLDYVYQFFTWTITC